MSLILTYLPLNRENAQLIPASSIGKDQHPRTQLFCFDDLTRGSLPLVASDMEFVKNFTPPDFQAENFSPSISPNFNSFSDKNTKKNE